MIMMLTITALTDTRARGVTLDILWRRSVPRAGLHGRQSSQTEPELPNPLVMESLQSFESLGTIKKLVLRMIAFTLEAWQVRYGANDPSLRPHVVLTRWQSYGGTFNITVAVIRW